MLEKLSDFDWNAYLALLFSISTIALVALVIVTIIEVSKKMEDERDHDADIDQAINIANSH